MSRTYRKLVGAKATERFRHATLQELAAAEFIKDIEFDNLDAKSILSKIQINAEKLNSTERKITFTILTLVSFLYFSISGVQFSLNYLGISLSDLKSIKEVTIVLILGLQSYLYVNTDSKNALISLHKAIVRKIYGDDVSKLIHAIEFPQDGIFTSFGLNIGKFRAGSAKLLIDSALVIIILVSAIVFLIFYLVILYRIQTDIWANSNLGHAAGRYFVVFTTIAFAGDLIVGVSRSFGKFSYINNEKLNDLHTKILTRENDSELTEMINEVNSKRSPLFRLRIIAFSLVLISLLIVSWNYLFDSSLFVSSPKTINIDRTEP